LLIYPAAAVTSIDNQHAEKMGRTNGSYLLSLFLPRVETRGYNI
jgi:hypothetical protein